LAERRFQASSRKQPRPRPAACDPRRRRRTDRASGCNEYLRGGAARSRGLNFDKILLTFYTVFRAFLFNIEFKFFVLMIFISRPFIEKYDLGA
jgi:hypothetical protein